ncbi:MAG: hypothetical protein ACAF41_05390 [Leptolyngbya sp. BL-A-14]
MHYPPERSRVFSILSCGQSGMEWSGDRASVNGFVSAIDVAWSNLSVRTSSRISTLSYNTALYVCGGGVEKYVLICDRKVIYNL